MPRTTRRRRNLKKMKTKTKSQRGGDLSTDIKQARAELVREVGDVSTITFAKLAEKKQPVDTSLAINSPLYPNLTVGDVANHLRIYLGTYFDTPSYTMESVRRDLASRKAAIDAGEEDLSYTFLSNIEAILSGQDTIDISNIQNYPLLSFYLVSNGRIVNDLPKPVLIGTGLVGPVGQ